MLLTREQTAVIAHIERMVISRTTKKKKLLHISPVVLYHEVILWVTYIFFFHYKPLCSTDANFADY